MTTQYGIAYSKLLNIGLAFALIILGIVTIKKSLAAEAPYDVSGTGTITWVADGDTVRVKVNETEAFAVLYAIASKEERNRQRSLQINKRFNTAEQSMLIRISNIDTDESVHPDPSRNTASGIRASDYAKRTFTGPVTFRCSDIGFYGRPICSVAGANFGDWGIHMIEAGFTDYETRYGRHPFQHQAYLRASSGQ